MKDGVVITGACHYVDGWFGMEVEEGEDSVDNIIRPGSFVKFLGEINMVYSIEYMHQTTKEGKLRTQYYKIAFDNGVFTNHYSIEKVDMESPVVFNREFSPI